MTARDRAWECALVLAQDHARSLSPAQHILCLTTVMRHPDQAPIEVIALAAMVLGSRT